MGMDLRDWEKESVPATGKEWRSICAGKVVSAGRGRQTGGGGVSIHCILRLQLFLSQKPRAPGWRQAHGRARCARLDAANENIFLVRLDEACWAEGVNFFLFVSIVVLKYYGLLSSASLLWAS